MKKIISLALLTTTLFADSAVEPTPLPPQPVDAPVETPVNTSVDAPANTPMDPAPQAPIDESSGDANTQTNQTPIEEPYVVECPEEPIYCEDQYRSFISAEFKMGYFRFSEKVLRRIYNEGLLDLQLTSSFRVWKPLYLYGAVEYISAEGRSIGGHENTDLRLVPLSLGMQYIQPITFDFKYYLTVGPRLFFFHQRNHSRFVPSTVNKWGCGGFVNTGFIYYLSHHIIFDVFGEYSYKRMHFESHRKNVSGNTIQVGGLTLGAGIGYFW